MFFVVAKTNFHEKQCGYYSVYYTDNHDLEVMNHGGVGRVFASVIRPGSGTPVITPTWVWDACHHSSLVWDARHHSSLVWDARHHSDLGLGRLSSLIIGLGRLSSLIIGLGRSSSLRPWSGTPVITPTLVWDACHHSSLVWDACHHSSLVWDARHHSDLGTYHCHLTEWNNIMKTLLSVGYNDNDINMYVHITRCFCFMLAEKQFANRFFCIAGNIYINNRSDTVSML